MKLLTGQDRQVLEVLLEDGVVFPDKKRINSPNAYPCYLRLFEDYNKQKNTNHETFFWAFSNLLSDEEISLSKRNVDRGNSIHGSYEVFMLFDVPDELVLETDYYNFSEQINIAFLLNFEGNQVFRFPEGVEEDEEVHNSWHTIYDVEDVIEVQAILPYLKKEWLIDYKII